MMLRNPRFTLRTILLFLMSLLIFIPAGSLYAQDDGDYDDDDYYDDEYYDDDYYDDDYYDDEYYDDDYYDDEYYDDYDDFEGEDYDEEDVDAFYEVDGLELLGNPTDEHQELWDTFVEIIPAEYIDGKISFFEVISDEDTSGYVYGDDDDPDQFVLGLNVLELDIPLELRHTIIHEFAHMLTLNADQIDIELERGGTCPTFELEEGCSDDDSYVYAFYEEFYEGGEDTSSDAFVTDYAGENIAEDMAESFTFFVLRPRPDGDTVAEEKILFFYEYDELVDLRDDIRDNLDL